MKGQNYEKKDLNLFTIQADASVHEALKIIEQNESGIVFIIQKQKLYGVISDGDLRRSLLINSSLEQSCGSIANKLFKYGMVDDSEDELQTKFSNTIEFLPLVDNEHNLITIIRRNERAYIQLAEPNLGNEELDNVLSSMRSNMISSIGNFVIDFENEFNSFLGAKRSFAVSNGTQALALALSVNGIGPGDEVIVPDLTFAATANAVIQVGATPVLVDVNLNDWNIEVDLIKEAISIKTKAIIPVHLYGLPCKMDEIMSLAGEFGLTVIEDAAEALGALYKGRSVGTLGHFSIFSFYANKLITTGEGGMVCVNMDFDFERIHRTRSHGMSTKRKYWHEDWGTNVRLTNIQSAIGLAQLGKVSTFTEKKKQIHEKYIDFFISQGLGEFIHYSRQEEADSQNAYWLSCFQVSKNVSVELISSLARVGIETRPFFPPLHIQPAFSKYKGISASKEWNSTTISSKGICLPSGTKLSNDGHVKVCRAIHDFFTKDDKESE